MIFNICISILIILCVYFAINIYIKKPRTKEKFKDIANIPLNDKCNFVGDGLQTARECLLKDGFDLAVWPAMSELDA